LVIWPAFTPAPGGGRHNLRLVFPELYDMIADPVESYDVSQEHPAIVAEIQSRINGILLGLPPMVQNAWRNTLNRPTSPVNPGEYPALKT
jgi:hypothetical protein